MSARARSLQSNRRRECEAVIERGLETFLEVGKALSEIRDSQLYRAKFKNFEDYCRDRWQIARNYANKLIAAAEVVQNLGTTVPIPASERQVRPLTKLEPEQQRQAWKLATAFKPNPTASQVKEAANTIQSVW